MTTQVQVIRDGSEFHWMFPDAPAGLEAFGFRDQFGRVIVRGRLAGEVAQDWLRDQGIEPVRVRR
ncbi:unnamed protein product [Gemmataceae bacterium]|nr:unnamed protein product [Gemmataceae bacterium]VTT99060.1 unnamed protein product [Gemmataceae bacterium]